MLVVDNAVPYPRQYVQRHLSAYDIDRYSGYMVPFAGAMAYWYWWEEDKRILHVNRRTEAELQSNDGYKAIRYKWPSKILPELLRS